LRLVSEACQGDSVAGGKARGEGDGGLAGGEGEVLELDEGVITPLFVPSIAASVIKGANVDTG
jgi:hypothetical protein